MDRQELVDTIYTEMAEFSFLTKYVFGTGIEEIDINSWRDIEVQYSGGVTKKLTERFESCLLYTSPKRPMVMGRGFRWKRGTVRWISLPMRRQQS